MANYSIQQITYSGKDMCLTPFIQRTDGTIHPINFNLEAGNNKPGDWGDQSAPYQQIILNGEAINNNESDNTFIKNKSYYLELEIPKDDNFSMDFALLLIPQPKSTGMDLDQLNYQFIRYLHVTQGGAGSTDQSRVVLYQKENEEGKFDESTTVEVAIAYPAPEEAPGTFPYEPHSLYYRRKQNEEIEYMWTEENWKDSFESNQADYGYNDIILSHSWKTNPSEKHIAKFQLIFTPRVEGMSCLYLYLIPTKEDNDIQWADTSGRPYYGRHVELKNPNDPDDPDKIGLTAKLYQINNLIPNNVSAVRRLGIWGRSELMLSINGEEVRIGPSNYYELQNFAVTELGVAAQSAADRFTIDIQY